MKSSKGPLAVFPFNPVQPELVCVFLSLLWQACHCMFPSLFLTGVPGRFASGLHRELDSHESLTSQGPGVCFQRISELKVVTQRPLRSTGIWICKSVTSSMSFNFFYRSLFLVSSLIELNIFYDNFYSNIKLMLKVCFCFFYQVS